MIFINKTGYISYIYFLCIFAATWLLPGDVFAYEIQKGEAIYELNGYYKNLFIISDTHGIYEDLGFADKKIFVDDYNRLRLKNQLRITDHFTAVCHYEAFVSNGDTNYAQYKAEQMVRKLEQAFGTLPLDESTETLNSFLSTEDSPRFFDMEAKMPLAGQQRMAHGIDRLFLRANSSYIEFEVGRMALSWGTGRVWNPTDMWSPFSPTQIDKEEKPGVDLAHVTFNIPKVGSLEGVFAPLDTEHHNQMRMDDSSAGGRLLFNIGEYDISVMGGYFATDTVAGFDFSGYIKDAGFRGEATYTVVNREDHERDYIRAVLSVDYGFAAAWNPYLLFEVYFNGMGESDPDDYLDRLYEKSVQRQLQMGRAFNLGRDYLSLMTTVQPHALVAMALQTLMNIDDQSFFVHFDIRYSALDFVDIIAGTNLFFGKENSEFGGLEIEGWDVSYRSPDMYYLYLKAYF